MPDNIKKKIWNLLDDQVDISDIKYSNCNSQNGKRHLFIIDLEEADEVVSANALRILEKEFKDLEVTCFQVSLSDHDFKLMGGEQELESYDNRIKQCIWAIKEKQPQNLVVVLENSALANDLLEVDIKYLLYGSSYSTHTYWWSLEKEKLVDNSHVDDTTSYIEPELWLTGLHADSIKKGFAELIEIRDRNGETIYEK